MQRKAKVNRVTKETNVSLKLNLDGKGKYKISTTIPFLDHMLEQFTFHGSFDLYIKAYGDTDVDDHHLVEDIGLCLGTALFKSLGDKSGINRYAEVLTPMDEALSYVVVDISGRPNLVYNVKFFPEYKKSAFDYRLIREFLKSFVNEGKITLHIKVVAGEDNHHICESIFKSLGRALGQAVCRKKSIRSIPTTKGKL
ncbi:MAG: imidazoleglycerol-phosphate dehydratase HisB [Endomicrobia bacterium]|nr:imidazoleglycerol-phosphate dehydratase HisB [Endomicrobiia bacterium]